MINANYISESSTPFSFPFNLHYAHSSISPLPSNLHYTHSSIFYLPPNLHYIYPLFHLPYISISSIFCTFQSTLSPLFQLPYTSICAMPTLPFLNPPICTMLILLYVSYLPICTIPTLPSDVPYKISSPSSPS